MKRCPYCDRPITEPCEANGRVYCGPICADEDAIDRHDAEGKRYF